MFRTLLTSTAIAGLLTAGAMAQDSTTTTTPAATDPAVTTTEEVTVATSILATGYTIADKDDLATEIIGKRVYSSADPNADHIGEVNNLVIGENGQVAAVVIGVGGFLGIGEKDVAVNFGELQRVTAQDGAEHFVLPATKEALEAAPKFEVAAAPANAPAATPIDRNQLADVPLTAKELIGTKAYGPNDQELGKVGDVVLGEDGATVEAVIIDFGGFLGIGTKPVAVAVDNLRFATNPGGEKFLFLNVTREQLDKAVPYNKDTFMAERDQQLLKTDALN